MCYCGQDIETTTHFLLHCLNHHCIRKTLFHKISQVSGTILRQSDSTITKILLFGDNKLDFEEKKILLRVYFINREIQLSLIWAKLNDSIVSFYSKIMKHLCFRLVTFFLHVKLYLLILVSGYSESLINLF